MREHEEVVPGFRLLENNDFSSVATGLDRKPPSKDVSEPKIQEVGHLVKQR